MIKAKTNLILYIGICLVCSPAKAEDTWIYDGNKDNIKVWHKKVAGSDFLDVRAEVEVPAPPAKVVTAFVNIDRLKEWAPDLLDAKIIEQITPVERIQYSLVHIPWPFRNREFLFHGQRYFDPANKSVSLVMKSIEDQRVPQGEKVIRAEFSGQFVISELPNQSSRVAIEVHVDPKGSVPFWLANIFQGSIPRKNLESLRKYLLTHDLPEDSIAKAIFATPASGG